MNILPIYANDYSKEYWGPKLWYLLHKMTYNYPLHPTIEQKTLYFKYFTLCVRIIPCPLCSNHFFTMIHNNNLYNKLENRASIIEWFKDLHNQINTSNNKRVYTGFELDTLYSNSIFNQNILNELILYLYNLGIHNIIEKSVLIYWILQTYKLHPCSKCKTISDNYFNMRDLSKCDWKDDKTLKIWIDGLIQITNDH